MRLQTDPTVIYGMGDNYDGNIRKIDLEADTPYNTYTRDGLPPTPIALPGTPALRRFSIDVNRLAWISPPGQNGQESSMQVLGWDGDSFGEIHTEPAQDLLILR